MKKHIFPKKNHNRQYQKNVNHSLSQDNIDEENFDPFLIQKVDNEDYNAMLKHGGRKRIKINNDLQTDPKYKMTRQIENEEVEDQKQDSQPQDQMKKQYINLKNQKRRQVNLMEEQIQRIQQQDQHYGIQTQNNKQLSINQSKHLRNQLQIFKKLVKYRYHSQNQIQEIKKYPYNNIPICNKLHLLQKQTQKQLLTNIKDNTNLLNKLAFKSKLKQNQQKSPIETYQIIEQIKNNPNYMDNKINLQKLYLTYENDMKKLSLSLQKQIIKWSQKTTLLGNNTNKANYSSLIMQTPIGQAQKIISNWQRVSLKSQQKKGTFKILFQSIEDIKQSTNKEIFDDNDLLYELQKQYEADLDIPDTQALLMNQTIKHLQERNQRKANHKDIDRKSSKNRKIRFNIHPKLLNFMCCQNPNLLQARDQLVANIFNKNKNIHREIDYIDL